MVRYLKIPVFILFLWGIFCLGVSSPAQEWQELKSGHFFIYFTADEKFAKMVLERAERYYAAIAADLGFLRYSEFWLWDNRCKIKIYPDHISFLAATDQPDWSHGMVDYKNKEIISYAWSSGFLESLLPHEMAHLIFRDFVGFKGEIPLWLDEGVAQWAEEEMRPQMKERVRQLYQQEGLLSIDDMMKLDIRSMARIEKVYFRSGLTKDGKKSVVILSTRNLVNTFYLEGFALVAFLIQRYGSESFAQFCRELRDGKPVQEALKYAYPNHIRTLDEFEKRWIEYLGSKY